MKKRKKRRKKRQKPKRLSDLKDLPRPSVHVGAMAGGDRLNQILDQSQTANDDNKARETD